MGLFRGNARPKRESLHASVQALLSVCLDKHANLAFKSLTAAKQVPNCGTTTPEGAGMGGNLIQTGRNFVVQTYMTCTGAFVTWLREEIRRIVLLVQSVGLGVKVPMLPSYSSTYKTAVLNIGWDL